MMYDSVVVGAGFYGCLFAAKLSKGQKNVLLVEAEDQILTKASQKNQARVHGGYHYPRSYMTARRSRANFKKFIKQFPSAILDDYQNIYAVSRKFSNITANQFEQFCLRIEAPLSPAPKQIAELFSEDLIEKAYLTEETSFNWIKLAEYCHNEINDHKVTLQTGASVNKISSNADGTLNVQILRANEIEVVKTKSVYLCTYSKLNQILQNSNIPLLPLNHEFTEMAVVVPPSNLSNFGITIMDGPFWSLMPFPARDAHTLSHVRYTPHVSWSDSIETLNYLKEHQLNKVTNYKKMVMDAARYLPSIKDSKYIESLWEIKTVLPRSSLNDSRPILYETNYSFPNVNLVLGGKIDNIFDILEELV